MVKVSFAGAYGINSQGDDAALLSFIQYLRKHIEIFEGVVITRHAEEKPYETYSLRSIQNVEYKSKEESIGKWFRGFNYSDDRSHLKLIQKEIASSDLLVLGAGNFLVDVSIDLLKGPIPYFVILTLIAKMTKTPVMWYGISVGPFRTNYGRDMSRLAAYLADIITVRDHQSCIELKKLGYEGPVFQLPDPVLGLYPPSLDVANAILSWREAHKDISPVIAISVRDMPSGCILETEQYITIMASICDALISRYNAKLLFIPHCTYMHGYANEDDRNIAKWIVDKIQNRNETIIVKEDLTVEQCLAMYMNAELALCTRLHANVYAAIQGVPSIAISYNPKVSEFMKWLKRDDFVVSLSDLSKDFILNKTKKALSNRKKNKQEIFERIEKGRGEVEQYVEIALNNISKCKI